MSQLAVILGAQESGTGAALLAKKKGWDVFVSDFGSIKAVYRDKIEKAEIEFEEGGHTRSRIFDADLVIKSPGIADTVPLLVELKEKGIPVISEIEFASRYSNAKIIAITGSNGKTTTTSLTGHILKQAGKDVAIAGNIGTSFASVLCEKDPDFVVLELSSFQLDGIDTFRPDVAILMNITPDHLDRYDNKLENYAASKMRIAANQTASDYFIYCADDPVTKQMLDKKKPISKLIPFSLEKSASQTGAWLDGDRILFHLASHLDNSVDPGEKNFDMSVYQLALSGKHNVYNSMAAGIASRVMDITPGAIQDSLSDFASLEHRLEPVATMKGVEYVNDSKGTNVNATWYAMETIDKPLIWIAGGIDKGNDYSILKDLVSERVKAIVCLGIDNRKLHDAFSRHVDLMINTTSMYEAVMMSHQLANPGDCVLLSPACASFDLFENYEDRGRQFKAHVVEVG
ncbi:MAG: UDP-N-acetylmuramoylalanine--D-glutamate ligase [Limisphaerales bacterium]|jgi:UDP-N-acetylmuramoylalanine--D-glutamate ligase